MTTTEQTMQKSPEHEDLTKAIRDELAVAYREKFAAILIGSVSAHPDEIVAHNTSFDAIDERVETLEAMALNAGVSVDDLADLSFAALNRFAQSFDGIA